MTRRMPQRLGRFALMAAVVFVVLLGAIPAWAALSGPSSATVQAGNAVSVSITTDTGGSIGLTGGHSGIAAGPSSGAGPTVRFTFSVALSKAPGSYVYTFLDGSSTKPFTLNVTAAPPTTTTSSTTTTRPPPTTSSTTTTTTTRPPTTTTEPPTTTTTEPPTTTTTAAPTTTTAPPTTTTTSTLPPTTTSSTLVPEAIAALDDGDGSSSIPLSWFGGGAGLLALIAGGAYLYSRTKPAHGTASPGFIHALRNRSQRRRATTLSRHSRTTSMRTWWRNLAPVVAVRESRSARSDAKSLNRKIEERRRLKGE